MWRKSLAVARSNKSFPKRPIGPFVPETLGSKKALVVGSSGALGREIVHQLQTHHDMTVLQADVSAPPTTISSFSSKSSSSSSHNKSPTSSSLFCDLSQSSSNLSQLTVHLADAVGTFLDQGETLDVVVCAAGGWAGNPPMANNVNRDTIMAHAQAYGETMDHMRRVNLNPVLATGFLIPYYMSRDSLLVMIGATAALQPTPDMLAYGMAKAATHFCVQSFGATTTQSLDPKSVRDRSPLHYPVTVVGLLPTILDTPRNRETMTNPRNNNNNNNSEPSLSWTPPRDIAVQIGEWVQTPALRPHSGALIRVFTNQQGETTFSIVK
jgi:dihydropteridine reductase